VGGTIHHPEDWFAISSRYQKLRWIV
jgi:hypothetical protein